MKKIFTFRKKKKRESPPSCSATSPCPTGAYELRPKELSKLHRAAAAGVLVQVRQALKKYSIDGRDKEQRTALHLACANGHADVVTFLVENNCKLNLPDTDNRSPLMKAVQCQQEKCATVLLEHGADPNLADASGNTALHMAAVAPNTSLARMLIEHSAHIDAKNKEGCTPLILAVSEHHEEMVELLLKKGADVHARDKGERTPLMTAAAGGELKLIKLLLCYGADLSHKDTNGWTAEDYAIIHGHSSLSKQLADGENTGEASARDSQDIAVPMTPDKSSATVFTLGAPAMDRAIDDISGGGSISSEKEDDNDRRHTSDEEELDFTPKSDSESLRKVSPGVLLPAADEHGACLLNNSGEHNNDECSDSVFHAPSSSEEEIVMEAIESCGEQVKCILETTNLVERTAHEKQTDRAEISPQEALTKNKESHSADKLKSWEERYERMWVENEKMELKAIFKKVTAELKQRFGEIDESEKSTSLAAEVAEDDFKEELENFCVSSWVTESSNKLGSKGEFGDTKLNADLEEPKLEIVISNCAVLPDHSNLNANMDNIWSADEEDCAKCTDNTEVPLAKGEEMEENENGISRNVEVSPEYSPRHCLETNILDGISNIPPKIRRISTNDESTLGLIRERKFDKDFQRLPYEIRVEKEEGKQKHFKKQTMEKQDLDKFSTPAGDITSQPVKEKFALRKNEEKTESERTIEEEMHTENSSSEERLKLTEMPLKSKSVLNAKRKKKKKKKRQSSKKKAKQKIQGLMDDSTVSETSQDEERRATRTGSKKKKVSTQMAVTDDLDLTQSSDTTTWDAEWTTSNCKKAMLLLEQLSAVYAGSAVPLKIQNILLEYEQMIGREKNHHTAVQSKAWKLENEKEEMQLIAEETKDLKSMLAHQEVEFISDIQSLRFSLKQEEERRLKAEMQNETMKEQLRKKEDQYYRETEKKQQLELHARNLETELISLRKLLKQTEEERDEIQMQLTQEKSARALQEGILNSHLQRQKDLEVQSRKTMEKNSEESDTSEREKDLLYKNQFKNHFCCRCTVRQLQQELAEALKKQSMSEASLEVTTRYRSDLEEDNLRLQKGLDRVKNKVTELSQKLELESKKCIHLEAQNQGLKEALYTLHESHEKLEKNKRQLKEEVAKLRHHLETNTVNLIQIEQYKKEIDERAAQEVRQKLQEVNVFLQAQADFQDRLEEIRASHHASLTNQLKHRIESLEYELDRIKNTQQDNVFQQESTKAEAERYKERYLEEMKARKYLGNKLK
ncbi:ankyrin repeat domain-containing protein 26-like [Cyrtonyx montezumae]|uniref:ankyrin repeat domain-containing protein 26-like n=1 Tax=Cyrtonyx montezumae TaxID=9017 RepID=UPI0032D9DC9C